MPLSSTKRALIVVAALAGIAVAGGLYYFHRTRSAFSGAASGRAPELLGQLPADAPVIAFADVEALRKMPSLPLAAALGLTAPGPQADRDYAEFVRGTGFDYTRDLDRAAIALWPASLDTTPTGTSQDRALAIADGRFDQGKIRAYALRTGKSTTRDGHEVFEVPGAPPIAFEFLSPTRLAIASGPGAAELLALPAEAPRDPATQARIDRVAGAPLFAVARTDKLPPSFYASLHNAPQFDHLIRSIRGLTLAGKPEGSELVVALDAECDSAIHSGEITTLLDGLRMFGSMALSDPKSRNQMTSQEAALMVALINQIKVAHDDRWVRLTIAVTPEMLGAPGSSAGSAADSRVPATRR